MNRYTIESEAGSFTFQHYGTVDGMEELTLNGERFWYEPGDSYLYDAPDGGESHYLGEVYSYEPN